MAIIFGINAVAEVLKAHPGRIERLCIEKGQRNPRVQEIVVSGRTAGLQLSFEERSWLDRKAAGQRHQGGTLADRATSLPQLVDTSHRYAA